MCPFHDLQENEFNNTYNLTGCLTIIDSLLNKVNIMGENFNCEDTLNFIRSSGSINNIQIKNSRSDSLDADFSKLKFNFIGIEKDEKYFDIAKQRIEGVLI